MVAASVFCFSLFAAIAFASDGNPKWCVSDVAQCRAAGLNITCVVKKGSSCVADVVNGEAHLTLANANEMAKYADKLSIVLAESYENTTDFVRYYGIAVVKKNSTIRFSQLKGKNSCHTQVGKTSGWKIPVGYLLRTKRMDFVQDQYKSASEYFGKSCAPTIKNKTEDKEVQNDLCSLCNGTNNNFCSVHDPFAGYVGAFKCMVSGDNDRVAFVKHTTPKHAVDSNPTFFGSVDDYVLLCPENDGTKATTEYQSCNIDKRPSNAIVTKRDSEDIEKYRQMINAADLTKLKTGKMVSDDVKSIKPVSDSTKVFLGKYYDDYKALSPEPAGKASSLAISLVLQLFGIFAFLFAF